MYLTIGFAIIAGAVFGGLLGRTRSCETGACPLTATPLRGAVWGGTLGLLAGLALTPQVTRREPARELPPAEQANRVKAFRENVLEHKGAAVAYFGADWCQYCKEYAPVVQNVVNAMPGVGYAYVNIDEVPRLAEEWRIQGVPATLLFYGGDERARFSGAVSRTQLRDAIQAVENMDDMEREERGPDG